MPNFNDFMRVVLPGLIGGGAQALGNRGKKKSRRTNPLATGVKASGSSLLGMMDESRQLGRAEEDRARIKGEADQALTDKAGALSDVIPGDESPEWVERSLQAGLSPDKISGEAKGAQALEDSELDDHNLRQTVENALSSKRGELGPATPGMPDFSKVQGPQYGPQEGKGFFESIDKLPEIGGERLKKLSLMDMAQASMNMDSKNQGIDFHLDKVRKTKPGQIVAERERLKQSYPNANPDEIDNLVSRYEDQLSGRDVPSTGYQMEQPLAENQQELSEWDIKFGMAKDLGWSDRASEIFAGGASRRDLEASGLVPASHLENADRQRKFLLDRSDITYHKDNMVLRNQFRPQAESIVGTYEEYARLKKAGKTAGKQPGLSSAFAAEAEHLGLPTRGKAIQPVGGEDPDAYRLDYQKIVDDQITALIHDAKGTYRQFVLDILPYGANSNETDFIGEMTTKAFQAEQDVATANAQNADMIKRIKLLEEGRSAQPFSTVPNR